MNVKVVKHPVSKSRNVNRYVRAAAETKALQVALIDSNARAKVAFSKLKGGQIGEADRLLREVVS